MKFKPTHGCYGTQTYRAWASMVARCTNPNNISWPRYGGRGITICERWRTFANFLSDVGLRPDGTSLDRINSAAHYEPGNCRWATDKEQALNRHTTRWIEFAGKRQSLQEWADAIGISGDALSMRLKYGWPIEEALTAKRRSVRHWGKRYA